MTEQTTQAAPLDDEAARLVVSLDDVTKAALAWRAADAQARQLRRQMLDTITQALGDHTARHVAQAAGISFQAMYKALAAHKRKP